MQLLKIALRWRSRNFKNKQQPIRNSFDVQILLNRTFNIKSPPKNYKHLSILILFSQITPNGSLIFLKNFVENFIYFLGNLIVFFLVWLFCLILIWSSYTVILLILKHERERIVNFFTIRTGALLRHGSNVSRRS